MEKLDLSQVSDVEVVSIDHSDAPDYVDAFIESASYMGREMTDEELDILNSDGEFVHQRVLDQIY